MLAADAWIIGDGPVHQSGRKQVVFGARGDTNVDLTVYAAKRPLHSGHYGNWSPNPAHMLARLLASMKDDDGRVTIDGWYSDTEPLGEVERRAIADAPQYDEELKQQLGIKRTEGGGKSLLELINQPSLNINGFASGDVGALARNVIPTTATAVLDLRLVKGKRSSATNTTSDRAHSQTGLSRYSIANQQTRIERSIHCSRASMLAPADTTPSAREWTCRFRSR